MSIKHRIFVPLANDREALREVEAVAAGDGRFRLVGGPLSGEQLLFKRGELVECEVRPVQGGKKDLVAIRSVSADPEYRKRRVIYIVFGAIIGGFVGVLAALSFVISTTAALYGLVIGGIAFALCSAIWGDAAWDMLVKILSRKDE